MCFTMFYPYESSEVKIQYGFIVFIDHWVSVCFDFVADTTNLCMVFICVACTQCMALKKKLKMLQLPTVSADKNWRPKQWVSWEVSVTGLPLCSLLLGVFFFLLLWEYPRWRGWGASILKSYHQRQSLMSLDVIFQNHEVLLSSSNCIASCKNIANTNHIIWEQSISVQYPSEDLFS